jgi:lipoate-protein ligase A
MCCGEFFLKRHQAFRHAGMDGVLIDIDGATCYELKQEQLAYAGVFKAEATLDLPLVAKVMEQVPPCAQRPVITDAGPRPGDRAASRRCADCPSAPTNR